MEYEKIKQLMTDMENSKLSSIEVEFPDGTKIKIKKNVNTVSEETTNSESNKKIEENEEPNNNDLKEETKHTKKGNIVTSPMVGTFYTKSSPTSEAYVEVGSEVKKGDVLCIIEAMKLMNEIESEFNGKIVEVYVKDGEPVEYGEPLFRII